jgi:uncharacterized protein YraI
MYTRKIIKSVLSLILVLSVVLQFNVLDTNAAATKTGYVSIESGTLNIRSGPGSHYKKIGSLKNNAQVAVYSAKNGWSEIRYNKKKAYVATQYLRMYSYLMDKTKVYTYKFDGKTQKISYKGEYDGWDDWISHSDGSIFGVKEDSKGLYTGFPESEYYTDIFYPLKVCKEWLEWDVKYKITSINGTLKTPAGTFKNVVTVKSSEGYTSYYAPNVGFIKGIYNGKTSSELISLVKKK